MNLTRILGFSCASRILPNFGKFNIENRMYHLLRSPSPLIPSFSIQNYPIPSLLGSPSQLLQAKLPQVLPSCGFKVKGRLRRRCKDCYFVVRDERTYIICPTHPRHKQMSFVKPEKNLRIMTPFGMQSKHRPW